MSSLQCPASHQGVLLEVVSSVTVAVFWPAVTKGAERSFDNPMTTPSCFFFFKHISVETKRSEVKRTPSASHTTRSWRWGGGGERQDPRRH